MIFWGQKFLPNPRNAYEQKFLHYRFKMTIKFCVKFQFNVHKKRNRVKQIRTPVLEDVLAPKVLTPKF